PTLNQPRIRTGILNRNNKIPVLTCMPRKSLNTLDTSCAAPVKPLAYTFALIKKKLSDTASKNELNITIAIRLASIKNMETSLSATMLKLFFSIFKKLILTIPSDSFKLKKMLLYFTMIEYAYMKVKMLTYSACDLSVHYYKEFDIEMVPLTVH